MAWPVLNRLAWSTITIWFVPPAAGAKLCRPGPLHQIQQQLETASGYKITYHEINLYGLCPDCQKKLATEKSSHA